MVGEHYQDKYKVIVIGAGQAGLSVGYFLSRSGIPFVILDANKRVGDSWRNRWDSLRLFTPAKFNGLAGLPFPSRGNYFPAKDEMGDYLEKYAEHFNLPVKGGIKVTGLTKEKDLFCVASGEQFFYAENVVIAMSDFQIPKVPAFAQKLNPDIVHFHSFYYRNASQFQKGDVLVVGAGNSGAEIALEASADHHQVWLSGRDTGHIPFKIDSALSRIILARLVFRLVFHRILTTSTPIGRKVRPKVISKGGPLIRIKPDAFIEAGVKRIPKIVDEDNGFTVTETGQILEVKNIVWCTGFQPSSSWIDIPTLKNKEIIYKRGVVEEVPGLYFTGLHFLYSFSSTMVHGAARDAEYIVKNIRGRLNGGGLIQNN